MCGVVGDEARNGCLGNTQRRTITRHSTRKLKTSMLLLRLRLPVPVTTAKSFPSFKRSKKKTSSFNQEPPDSSSYPPHSLLLLPLYHTNTGAQRPRHDDVSGN